MLKGVFGMRPSYFDVGLEGVAIVLVSSLPSILGSKGV